MVKVTPRFIHKYNKIYREYAFIALTILVSIFCVQRLISYAQYSNSQVAPTAVPTSITTARKCFDSTQKQLSATDPDPAAYFRHNGDWVCFDTKKKELVERNNITMQSTCVMYWRPSETGPVDQSVYVIGQGFSDKTGFANYGASGYCTNWAYTSWPSQKEMRCWSNGVGEDGNLIWFGWADAQGIRGMPADPGNQILLEPELRCAGIGPGEWKWRTIPEPIPVEPPASENADALLHGESEVDVPVKKKKIPLIQLLRKRTQQQ